MRYPLLIAIVSLARSAAAQPVDPPPFIETHPCSVTIVHAPDDVRREIEDWVHREVECRISLDVRAIPTDGGLYLVARASTGQLHERLVPDAQTAGVLVASWIANDSLEPIPPPPPPPLLLLLPAPAPPFAGPPTRPMLEAPRPCGAFACSGRPGVGSWGLGVTVLSLGPTGARLRGDFDFARRGSFAVGLVLAGGTGVEDNMYIYSRARRADARALGALSFTMRQGMWSARAQAAAGAVWSHVFKDESAGVSPANWAAVALEASLLLGYHLSDQWSVGVAPVATFYNTAGQHDAEGSLGASDLGLLLELRRGP